MSPLLSGPGKFGGQGRMKKQSGDGVKKEQHNKCGVKVA